MIGRRAILERQEIRGWVPVSQAEYEKERDEKVKKWGESESGQEELSMFIGMKGRFVNWWHYEAVPKYSAAKGCHWGLKKIGV